MVFGGTGGFSFGGNNNNNQNTGFGFGSSNTNTGFGASTTNTGFGSSTTGTNPFGGGTSTFGSNTGFGSNANTGTSLFAGNKPATTNPFGSTTGSTGLFGNNNASNTSGFASTGFGSSTNTGGFGSTNTGTGGFTFGASNNNKTGFGSSTTTPLFGQNGAGTTGGFGSTAGFGSSNTGTGLNQPVGPSDGTASTPFSATTEKEANGVTNSYQSITFQQPYQKYSFEELRLADYNAGRQFGNGSGQPGAFGSNAFGGFGSNNTGGFGNTNTSTNPFGTTTTASTFGGNTATTGFGSSGSTLFGNNANKPGGLFGSTTTTSAGTAGGLFGTANNNTTGFGSNNTGGFGTNSGATGGLFGGNQNKPTGGLFGGNAAATNNAFSFGNNNNNNAATNAGGGLFANTNSTANTGGGLFGNSTQTNTGGLFSSANNQGNSLFNNKTGTGFGTQTTQAQTGGLFGNSGTNTSTGGGLFGSNTNTANTNTTGGLFGNNTNTNTGGGLFGNNANQAAQKPLFGGFGQSNPSTNTGGGLFGNNTNNQQTGGLFGNTNNTTGGFNFGNNNANKPNNSLFSSSSTGQQGGGLFGPTNNNNLFSQSQNNQPNSQQQQDGVKHASLLDPNPYGQSSIWTGLPQPTPENAKPVFTPLTATQKMKESMMKPPPSLRLNQSRYMTPPRRNGFGFSYSTYGTPNSAASTPGGAGLSGSMYGSRGFSGGSFGRSFNKSASVQNLRSQFASDSDDLWKPGAFASTHRNSSGSIKRLTIDRSIRNDLFSRPSLPALPAPEQNTMGNGSSVSNAASTSNENHQEPSNKLKKRVSFESGTSGGLQNSHLNGETGALVRTESDRDDHTEQMNGRTNGVGNETQSRGKDLAAVPEDRESHQISSPPANKTQAKADPQPGDYWMNPSRAEQAKMSRETLQRFIDFQVGRYGCGMVTFNGAVDLTALPLDELYEKIVLIRIRSVTVYPDLSSKPPVGKGLNVPSTLTIENSWPRAHSQPSSAMSGPIYEKHIKRLKKMPGTEFISYEPTAGIWTFRVPHYTRYGLDYDDDDDVSELTAPPETIEKSDMAVDTDEIDDENDRDNEDDTFAFRQRNVPGGFGQHSAIDYQPKSSSLTRAVEFDDHSEQSAYSDEEMSEDEPSMAGSYPTETAPFTENPFKPILKASTMGTPGKPLLDLEGDWAEQLQRTISPRKQNRDMLRETQNNILIDRIYSPIKPKPIEKDFRTSIDVMNSLFGLTNEQGNNGRKKAKAVEPDFEFPYAKRAKTFDANLDDMSKADRKWHESFRAQFTGVGDFIYKRKSTDQTNPQPGYSEKELVGNRENAIIKSSLTYEPQAFDLKSALAISEIVFESNVPFAQRLDLPFSYIAEQIAPASTSRTELDTYALLHILFDNYEDEFTHDLSPSLRNQYEARIRRDRLTKFLSSYIIRKHGDKLAKVERENPIAAAIIRLTSKDIKGACDVLEKTKNYKLMILVSQLENAGETFQDDVKAQVETWREQRALSEISEDVRAIYEICAGNTTICAGKAGNNVPVEDKAKTFSIGDEYGLDWVQSFVLGMWFGREEKRHASSAGVVTIETAVLEFEKRCHRKEESQSPGNDPLWVVLKLYAVLRGGFEDIQAPILPTALEALNDTWDASKALNLHLSIITNIQGVTINEDVEEELTGLLAYQLSSKGDIAGAAYTLLQLHDPNKRETTLKSLLERFAGQLPDPPSVATSDSADTVSTQGTAPPTSLWTVLTQQLQLPESWLYQAKALHARALSTTPTEELRYLVAAKSWDEAHDCFIHRVAPGMVVDDDIEALTKNVNLFEDNVMEKVSGWDMGGGVYADFALMATAEGQLNQEAVEGLRKRLVELGRRFKKGVDLGKLPIEELEQRVAVQEMSRVVAGKYVGSRMDILELPLTSDQRLIQTMAMAGEYYRGIMAGGGGGGEAVGVVTT